MRSLTVIAAVLSTGCLESQGKNAECGQGQAFAFGGAGYCVYSAAIIIEGFDCPPTLPFRHDSPGDGLVVCSPTDEEPVGGWDGLIDAWQEGHPTGDATVTEVQTGPRSACEAALDDLRMGELVNGATDSGCTLARHCSDGVVASCDHGALACDCPYGELRCVEITNEQCPPREASLQSACLVTLGDEACSDGLWCSASLGTCEPLTPLCDATACYDDQDCQGACQGEGVVSSQLGRCVNAFELPGRDCWDPNDCASGWTCADVLQTCAPCTACADYQASGACRPEKPLDPALGLARGVDLKPILVAWAYDYAFIECSTLLIEVRDELTGEWNKGPTDDGCVADLAVEFAAGTPHLLPTITPTSGFDYAWVRVSATMLRGCGQTPDTCQGQPIALSTGPVLVK